MNMQVIDLLHGVKIARNQSDKESENFSILFGVPPEVIKFIMLRELDFPEYIVLPDIKHKFGTLQNSTEFTLYFFLFVQGNFFKGRKLNIIGTNKHLKANRELLRLTLLGPTKAEYDEIGSNPVFEQLYRESRAIALKNDNGKEYTIDDFVNFIPFEKGVCEVGNTTLKHIGINRYLVKDHKIDINFDEPQHPPYDLRGNYVPILPSRFGVDVLGGASGFIPDKPCSGLILNYNSDYMLIDCVPYLEHSLNARGISKQEVKSIFLTHIHDDHCNIFPLVEFADKINFIATKEVYWMALKKLSLQTLSPMEECYDYFNFVEVKAYEDNKFYGLTIHPHYTVHSIPTIGATFKMKSGGREHSMVFGGDNKSFKDIEQMVVDGQVNRDKFEHLRKLYTDRHDIVFADGGQGILHGEPIDALHSKSDRIVFMHLDRLPAEFDTTFSLARAGKKYTIESGNNEAYIIKTMQILKNNFTDISDSWSTALMANLHVLTFNAGDIIIKQGEESRGIIYVILSGKCSIMHHDGEKLSEKAIKEAGEFIGEMAIVKHDKIRSASIVAKTPVTLGAIDEELFYEFLVSENHLESIKRLWSLRSELEKNYPFSMFPDYVNDRLARAAERLEIPSGKVVIEQGAKESDFYIVLQGRFEVTQGATFINDLTPGDMFGEYGSLAEKVRNANVTASEDSTVLKIHRDNIHEIISATPRLNSYINQLIRARSEEVKRIRAAHKSRG